MKAVLTSSVRHDWETPPELFGALNDEFGFHVDVCADEVNAKCRRFYTVRENGLAQKWSGMCWMNPPYGSDLPRFIRKAYQSAVEGDATVVCLVPARTDTRWFHTYCVLGEIRFIPGRIKFVGSKWTAPFPAMVVIFHAYLDPGGIMKTWDWRQQSCPSSQMSLRREQ